MQTKIKELKNCILISDYHTDFYELAQSRSAYGQNIECEVWVALPDKRSFRLPWIDIYADGQSAENSSEGHPVVTSTGASVPEIPDRRAAEDPAHDDVPAMTFYPAEEEKQSNLCYVHTDKLFGKTIRQCALAWAKHHRIEIGGKEQEIEVGEEDVIVISDFKPSENWPLTNENSEEFHTFEDDLRNYNPELLVRWGVADETIFDQLEQNTQEKNANTVMPPQQIKLPPEVLEQMRQNMSEEEIQKQLQWIEDFNNGNAQAKISRVKDVIFDLIDKGTPQALRSALANGTAVDARSMNGRTMLHIAAMKGSVEMVRILLEAGADVNATYEDDCSPIYLASQCGHTEIVRMLIEAGADLEKSLESGHTALLIASQQGHTETVKALLEAGADTTAVRVCDRVERVKISPFKEETIVVSGDGLASLSVAVQQGHFETVKALLNGGADINAYSENAPCVTALHLAVIYGFEEIVKLLVKRGADLNLQANDGCAALHIAVMTDKPRLVKLLLEAGADPLVENYDSDSVIALAIKNEKQESIPLLLNAMQKSDSTGSSLKGWFSRLFKPTTAALKPTASQSETIQWIEAVAEQGNANIQYVYALCYMSGYGVEQNPKTAVSWFHKAAQQGQPSAQYQLALCYLKGEGTEENQAEAMRFCRQAAEKGHRWAQFNLGMSCLAGDGVEQNVKEGSEWIRKAAEQGLPRAQRTLGELYEHGKGVELSITEAVKWYREAVKLEDAVAQFNLAHCYEEGIGVEQNLDLALRLYCKSRAQGFMPALQAAAKLSGFSFVCD